MRRVIRITIRGLLILLMIVMSFALAAGLLYFATRLTIFGAILVLLIALLFVTEAGKGGVSR